MSAYLTRLAQGYSVARTARACGVSVGVVQYAKLMQDLPGRHGIAIGHAYRWLGSDTKPFKRPNRVTVRGWVHYTDHLGGAGKVRIEEFKRWAGL